MIVKGFGAPYRGWRRVCHPAMLQCGKGGVVPVPCSVTLGLALRGARPGDPLVKSEDDGDGGTGEWITAGGAGQSWFGVDIDVSRASTGRGAAIQRSFGRALSMPSQENIHAMRRLQPNRRAVGAARRCAAVFDRVSRGCFDPRSASGRIPTLTSARHQADPAALIWHLRFSRSGVLTRGGALPSYPSLALTRGECQRSPSRDQ